MVKKYYILNKDLDPGPERGDVMVWEGEIWNDSPSGDEIYIARYIFDYDGFYFLIPRSDMLEVVSEGQLENPDKTHRSPPGFRKIWNTPHHA